MFRPQRGSLADSMMAKVELAATKSALANHLLEPTEDIESRLYWTLDKRIGWEKTYIVTVRGQAVGFTNQEIA